jgi:hypothetical protein
MKAVKKSLKEPGTITIDKKERTDLSGFEVEL